MSGFSFSKLKQAKPSMRRRLFLYMGALAALLLVTLFAVLLLLGQLKSPREELVKTLTFRMEAFQSDMESLWRNVSVMGLHLSEDMTAILEKQTTDLSKLDGDADAVERLEDAMLEPLCQYVRQTDCSGAFVMLNTSPLSAILNPSAACMSSEATLPTPQVGCCSTAAWRTSDGGMM